MESQPSGFTADGAADGSGFSDGNMGSNLPVTLVVSGDMGGGRGEGVYVGVENTSSVLSALGLQGTTTMPAAAQFYIEQLPNGQARLQTADGQTIEIDVDPSVVGLVESGSDGSSGMPVLLRVADDGTLLPDLSVASTVQSTSSADSQQVQAAVANTLVGGQESEENGDAFPPGMYIEVHKETEDASDSLGGSTGTSGVGTALAIVTPDGDESDQEEEEQDTSAEAGQIVTEIGVDRLEDFMDVVTTYRCKFCRFSCAWKSGLMSHFRSCHVSPPRSTTNNNKMAAPMPRRLHQAQARSSTPTKQPPQPERITPDLPPVSSVVTAAIEASSASKNKLDEVLQTIQEDLVDEPEAVVSSEGGAEERHIFICGQCSQGFETLEECKDHMVQSHEARAEDEEGESKKPSPGETQKRNQPCSILSSGNQENAEEMAASHLAAIHAGYDENDPNEATDDATEGEVSPRRKVHAPKVLEEEYLLQPVRKKRSKRDGAAERLFRCGERSCGYRFRTEEKLEFHVRCHTTPAGSTMGDNRPFRCVECGEQSDHWRGLAMHLWRIHRIDLDLQSCTHCPYKTFSLFKLDNHMRIHSEERDFTCDQCGKGFKQLSQLRNHHVVHLDRKNMPHKRWYSEQTCDLCQRTFSDSKCLRKHQQAVHNKVKPYVCTVCGHMSARKAMLQLHLRQHTGEKPFACNACDYRTGDHNSLRRHKMRHSGTKPYKCPHCSYACIQAISYKTHMKNKHPGLEGLYACSMCNFRSVSKENFVNHMSDHKNGILTPATTTTADGQNTQLTEGSLQQQLEGLLPGNLSAAQLIYSCLSALQQQQEGGSAVTQLPPGVTSYSAGDGTHTITIQVPSSDLEQSLLVDQDQFFLTVQQQEDGVLSYLGTAGDGSSSATVDTYGGEEDTTVVATSESPLKIGDVHSAETA